MKIISPTILFSPFFFLINIFYSLLLTNTRQVVGRHSNSVRAATVKRSRDIEAMMTASAIVVGTFVDVYEEYIYKCLVGESLLMKCWLTSDNNAYVGKKKIQHYND